jgi:hypothetical protein
VNFEEKGRKNLTKKACSADKIKEQSYPEYANQGGKLPHQEFRKP